MYRDRELNIKRWLKLLTAVLFIFQILSQAGTISVQAQIPNINYTGRIDFSNPSQARFSYSGVRIRAVFEGTSIRSVFKNESDNTYYYCIIDSGQPQKFKLNKIDTVYVHASGLKDTIHTIEIIRLTETFTGISHFSGFILDEGKQLKAMPTGNSPKIEFIGNSITCGYGIEVLDRNLHFDPATENFYDTYASLVAQAFEADYHAVCQSGIGLYRNHGDPSSGSSTSMFHTYNRTIMSDSSSQWDFNRFTPHLVSINLGTNDFSNNGADTSLFTSYYVKFLDTLRLKYPDAHLLLLAGPMDNSSNLINSINRALTQQKAKGEENISFFELSAQGALGMGADWHPSRAQARKNAGELIGYISSIMNWPHHPLLTLVQTDKTGDKIILNFSDSIITTEKLPVISLNSGIVARDINKIEFIDSHSVQLSVSPYIQPGEQLYVSYQDTTITSVIYYKALPFYDVLVQNRASPTLPLKASYTTSQNFVTLSFNKVIKSADMDGIILTADENPIIIAGVEIDNKNPRKLYLYFNDSFSSESILNISILSGFIVSSDGVAVRDVSIDVTEIIISSIDNEAYRFIQIYPVPVHDDWFFVKGDFIDNQNITVQVFDCMGRLTNETNIYPGNSRVYFNKARNDASGGVYFVKINYLNNIQSFKVVKL